MPEVKAELRVRLERTPRGTEMVESFAQAPLKVAKTFALPGGMAGVTVMDVSPGMLAGDRYEQVWSVGTGASVRVSTQSFARIHPSDGRPSVQTLSFELGPGAWFEWMPEPVMPFRDARFVGCCRVRMAPGAVFAMTEVLCPGRTLRGEVFRYTLYDSRLCVRDGREIWYDGRLRIEPGGEAVRRRGVGFGGPGVWGGYTHLGALWVFSDRVKPMHADLMREAAERSTDGGALLAGVGVLARNGVVVQALGHRAWEIRRLLQTVWDATRVCLC